jgi:hypothetical protein
MSTTQATRLAGEDGEHERGAVSTERHVAEQEQQKVSIVTLSYGIIHPDAVVVKPRHSPISNAAKLGARRRDQPHAGAAPPGREQQRVEWVCRGVQRHGGSGDGAGVGETRHQKDRETRRGGGGAQPAAERARSASEEAQAERTHDKTQETHRWAAEAYGPGRSGAASVKNTA